MATKTDLLIVESPAKARTIARFLGERFDLMSSMGHVADLPRKGMSIDIENGFAPAYEVSADKRKVIAGLRKAAKTAERVWLASDEDREGEAIAWHLARVLKLKPAVVRRIVFHPTGFRINLFMFVLRNGNNTSPNIEYDKTNTCSTDIQSSNIFFGHYSFSTMFFLMI